MDRTSTHFELSAKLWNQLKWQLLGILCAAVLLIWLVGRGLRSCGIYVGLQRDKFTLVKGRGYRERQVIICLFAGRLLEFSGLWHGGSACQV